MQKVNLSLLLLVVFLLGACAMFVAKEVAVPPVRAGTDPQNLAKLEYECVVIRYAKKNLPAFRQESANKLNEYGFLGWELVSHDGDSYCFRRPL